METKICSKCGKVKLVSEFYLQKVNKDGLYNWCKECEKTRSRKAKNDKYANDPEWREKKKQYYKDKYKNNPEYRKKQKQQTNQWRKNKWKNDSEYRLKQTRESAEYQNNRYKNDPEYKERKLQQSRCSCKKRYKNDPEYREKTKQALENWLKTKYGKERLSSYNANRRHNLGFELLFDNPFNCPVDYHHISDAYVLAVPKEIHRANLGKGHRQRMKPIVEELYNFSYIIINN